MKKKILFSVIGAVVIFVWQFLSFAMPNFHKSSSRYTAVQDSILDKLSALNLEEGMYMLRQPDPSLSFDKQKEQMAQMEGKSWAVLNYHKTNSMSMAMNMFRGFLVCIVISFLLFWIFLQQKDPTLVNRMLVSLAIGLIGFFFSPYTSFIWYKEPGIFAYFADGIIPWLILGFIGHKMAPAKE
ncbi:MAG: hypothetical protein HXX13_16230 [Bacteroidetes bacterium]|nr:hypothetical protein [Bacteroidota bacterium]